MDNHEVILCPHCNAELAVPPGATQFLCWSCQGKIELVADEQQTAAAPAAAPASGTDDDDEWEIVDVKKERHIAWMLAGLSCWTLAAGLWLAPAVPAWLWMPFVIAAAVFCIVGLFPKRTKAGFVVLAVTLVSAIAAIVAQSVAWHGARAPTAKRAGRPTDRPAATASQWDLLHREISELRARRVRALTSEIRDRVRIGNPRLQWRRTGITTEPIVQFDLLNYSRFTLSEILFEARVTAPEQPDPLLDVTFRHTLKAPLFPRERTGILIEPEEFAPLANREESGRVDLALSLSIRNARNPEGKSLIETFTDADAARLAALEEELERL